MKYRKAIFIVTYAKSKGSIDYLILKRKLHWKGWEFPKGGLKKFETKRKAVKRELKEETGMSPLKTKKFNLSGKYNYSKEFEDRKGYKGQTFSLYGVEVKKRNKISVDSREHTDYKWVNYEKASRSLKWQNQKDSIKIVNDWLKKESKKR